MVYKLIGLLIRGRSSKKEGKHREEEGITTKESNSIPVFECHK